MREVDVAIIGAGSGGLSARREVSKVTDSYLVIDGGKLGTTCARVGCMPSKVLIQVANDFHRRLSFDQEGIEGASHLSLNQETAMKHVRSLRDRFVRGVTGSMESWMKTHFIAGYATFKDLNTLIVNGEEIKAKKIIIASGSSPSVPPILSDFKDFLITTDEVFELENLPSSVAVVGLGVIGLELGQAFHRLGVDVFGIARRKSLAGISDPKLLDYTVEKFSKEMNLSFDGIQSVNAKDGKICIKSGSKEIVVDKVLITSGRSVNMEKFKLKELGVECNLQGVPLFDKNKFQVISHPHLFIAGDNTGENQILHEASDEGKIAGYNSVNEVKNFQTRTPLFVTFCDPNIAFSGKKYLELKEHKVDFEVGEVSFEGQGRSIVKLKEKGMLRIYGDKKTGKILGSEMFGPDCEHIAHLLSWVIEQGLSVNKVLSFPFYHPVIEEGLRTALRDLRDKVDEKQPILETLLK